MYDNNNYDSDDASREDFWTEHPKTYFGLTPIEWGVLVLLVASILGVVFTQPRPVYGDELCDGPWPIRDYDGQPCNGASFWGGLADHERPECREFLLAGCGITDGGEAPSICSAEADPRGVCNGSGLQPEWCSVCVTHAATESFYNALETAYRELVYRLKEYQLSYLKICTKVISEVQYPLNCALKDWNVVENALAKDCRGDLPCARSYYTGAAQTYLVFISHLRGAEQTAEILQLK